jgi:hypothetical protein
VLWNFSVFSSVYEEGKKEGERKEGMKGRKKEKRK